MNPIRKFLESVVFAGMKPAGQTAPKPRFRLLGPLRGTVERLLSGGANRTPTQKLKSWSLIAIPCLILVIGIAYTLRSLDPPEAKPQDAPTAAEITARLLPNIDKDLKLSPASDVQVLEVYVAGSMLLGTVQNSTAREIGTVQLVIDLTTSSGSHVGGRIRTGPKCQRFQKPVLCQPEPREAPRVNSCGQDSFCYPSRRQQGKRAQASLGGVEF